MTTDTDRELLELAAKAEGIEGAYESWTGQGFKDGIRQILNGAKCQRPWNPLTDDGDALRLAVKLGISVGPDYDEGAAVAFARDGREFREPHDSDPYAATRRAIVACAAEIWRAMP